MKSRLFAKSVMRLLFLPTLFLSNLAAAQQIRGDYIETRSADVYTGQCFANGEVNLVGNEAIVAWHVESGSWDGVALDGLTVAAAVRAKATLGDPYADPYPAQSVVLVDDQATTLQRTALVSFAHQMAGELLSHVDQVIVAPMEMVVNHGRESRTPRNRAASRRTVCHCADSLARRTRSHLWQRSDILSAAYYCRSLYAGCCGH